MITVLKVKMNNAQSHLRYGLNKTGLFFKKGWERFKALKRTHQVMAVVMFVALIVFASWGTWFYMQVTTSPSHLFDDFPDQYDPGGFAWEAWDAQNYFDQNIINVVLLGFDRNQARESDYTAFRTDSIKVISINFNKKKANIINIPRDIYIQIHDTSVMDKIGHAYVYGFYSIRLEKESHLQGIQYSLKTISNVLAGVPLNYYVALDMDAVVKLVDSIGGVEFNVEEDIYNRGRIWVPAGHQVLDGEKYLRYLRSREDGGDIGRVNRQTELLLATLDHFKRQGLFIQVPALYNASKDLVDTNLNSQQIVSLALFARNLSAKDIETFTISGRGQSKDGVYYMAMNQAKRSEIIKEVFDIHFEAPPDEVLKDTTPASPRSLAIDYLTNEADQKGLLLTWEPGDRFNLAYNLYRTVNDQDEELLSRGIEEEKFWDLEISPGNSYSYRLVAVNRRAVSSPVSASFEVKEKFPEPPKSFAAWMDGQNVTLTWEAGDKNTTGFHLVRQDGYGKEKVLLDGEMLFVYEDKSLPPGKYTYKIFAVNTAGFFSDFVGTAVVIDDEFESDPEVPEDPEPDPDPPEEPDPDPEDPEDPEDPDPPEDP